MNEIVNDGWREKINLEKLKELNKDLKEVMTSKN